jgi:hypothetical protein
LKRLRRKLCIDTTKAFGGVVSFLTSHVLQDAAALAVTGSDFRSANGFKRLNGITEQRISKSEHPAAVQLRMARPAIRKAIVAAVFTWLRIQFPVLNTAAAVYAADVLRSLLTNRKPVE